MVAEHPIQAFEVLDSPKAKPYHHETPVLAWKSHSSVLRLHDTAVIVVVAFLPRPLDVHS